MESIKNKKTIYILIIAGVIILGAVVVAKTYAPSTESSVGDLENIEQEQTQITPVDTTEKKNDSVRTYKTVEDAITAVSDSLEKADYEKTKILVESTLREYPSSGVLHVLNAQVLEKLGEKAKALAEVQIATQTDPTNYLAWRYLIRITRDSFVGKTPLDTEYKNTISKLYEQALLVTKNNIELITPYAIFLEEAGDRQGALKYWNLAITINPMAKSSYEQEIKRIAL